MEVDLSDDEAQDDGKCDGDEKVFKHWGTRIARLEFSQFLSSFSASTVYILYTI